MKEFDAEFPSAGKKPKYMFDEEWNEIQRGYQQILIARKFVQSKKPTKKEKKNRCSKQ